MPCCCGLPWGLRRCEAAGAGEDKMRYKEVELASERLLTPSHNLLPLIPCPG